MIVMDLQKMVSLSKKNNKMKKLLLLTLLIHPVLISMDKDLSMTKTLDLIFSYKPHKKIFAPLPIYQLNDLIISDKCIGTYIEHYQQGNQEYLDRVKTLTLYELSKISKEADDQKLVLISKRLHVLDTMFDQLNSRQFSQIVPINTPNQSTNDEKHLPVRPPIPIRSNTINRNKKNNAHHVSKPIEKIKLNENSKGKYVTINSKKVYVLEGQHVKVFGIDWVVIGNKLINLDIGKVIIDANDNCHIRDLTGQLRCLHHGKNEWVTWDRNNVYLYRDKQLQFIPHESSITINDKRYINYQGNLCFIESNNKSLVSISSQKELFKSVTLLGMQEEIIDILGKSTNHGGVAQRLDTIIQEVFLQAQEHNYVIHPEVDWRLQLALKALPQSVDAKEFTFHLATVEHLVHDIQTQTAQSLQKQLPVIERTSALLAQAVTKYYEYLAPTENELALVVDLARYVSDITIGTQYLPSEVRTERIEKFWNTIKEISFDISKVTAEQIIDGAMYVAARATYACGLPEVIAVIKDIIEGIRIAASFAEQFKDQFDQILQNPIIITGDGTVIANASQDEIAEARQLIQAFDGMKNKPSEKKPEILDDTQKLVDKEKKVTDKTVGDLIKKAKPARETKGRTTQYELPGGFKKALEDFESLQPTQLTRDDPDMKIGTLRDGRTVVARTESDYGTPTLEIQSGKNKIKFRYLNE